MNLIYTTIIIVSIVLLYFITRYITKKLHLWDDISLADRSIVFLLVFVMCFLTIVIVALIFAGDSISFLGL